MLTIYIYELLEYSARRKMTQYALIITVIFLHRSTVVTLFID